MAAKLLAVVVLLTQVSHSVTLELTRSNFEEKTKGKTVFIKAYSPTCTHCQELAPAWEKLEREWEGHEQGFVASIDCTVETKFCNELGIQGLPHIFYGDPSANGIFLKEFGGDKSLEVLQMFANETLNQKICSAGNLDACEGEELRKLQYFLSLSVADLQSLIQEKEQKIEQAEDIFETKFEEMQKQYDSASNQFALDKGRIQKRMDLIMDVMKTKDKK